MKRNLTPLCELARKHSTDKGGEHYTYNGGVTEHGHAYTPVYYDLLHGKREQIATVLEIGVNAGCSLRMWEEFFPSADIFGIDIDPGCLFTAGRIRCVQADQGDGDSLHRALQQIERNSFDLIVDDGSHEVDHQIISARTLLPYMGSGGIYTIEDLTHPADYLIEQIGAMGFRPDVYKCTTSRGLTEELLVFHG